jgi:hypothetical protein
VNRKLIIIAASILIVAGLLAWLFKESTKPLPGQYLMQDGRDHKDEGSKIDYKFNPPTSGDHYASWISKGFYDEPRSDGNLVHSEEHGYIIIWYDCEKQATSYIPQLVGDVYAQAKTMTAGSEGSPSAKLSDMPKAFSDGSCDSLKQQIKDAINKFGPHKLIGVPRMGMDSRLVLTAWGRSENLGSFNEGKIKEFIDSFRDTGPERTVEP